MRHTEYYNQPSPELGEIADITVVTDAILAGEKNQSGKIEFLKATSSGDVVSLTSESRTNKLVKHYDGLTVAFIAPIGMSVSDVKYTLKIDELVAQPFKIKTEIKQGEYVLASFNNVDGFVSANNPIPRSSEIDSNSEVTVATSKAVNDVRTAIVNKKILAGKGLQGGGGLTDDSITINVVSANDGITCNDDNIVLNTLDINNSTSATKPLSANQGRILAERASAVETNKADKTIKLTVGHGLSGGGSLAANMTIAHLSGNGWGHIPANGSADKFLKFSSTGVATWADADWSVITNKPSTFTPTAHMHKKSEITDFPSTMPNPNALTIQANGVTLATYTGASAATANITPANVGTYTRAEIDAKLQAVKSVPVPVGGLLMMYTTQNPAEIYTGTTWEAIANDRYLRTGASPLTLGGSNSVTLTKANLPNVKLKVDTFSLTTNPHYHYVAHNSASSGGENSEQYIRKQRYSSASVEYAFITVNSSPNFGRTSNSSPSTGSSSPSTESMGSGSAFSITPAYINVKIWKRLS